MTRDKVTPAPAPKPAPVVNTAPRNDKPREVTLPVMRGAAADFGVI
ncbi:hypothetical protein [Deinococcus aquatilis]|nr:hypothetical protein [Deinococcus aquatilis]